MAQAGGASRLGGWRTSLIAGAAGLLIGGLAVALYYGVRAPSRADTEAIVHNYILDHGELLPKAIERMERRQAASAVTRNRAALETPWRGAWAGAANGDVVLVQFFDYACGYCRVSNPDIDRLLSEDPRLKVVWRELPVLGPDSQAAAHVSLAAAEQGRFRQFHARMFGLGLPSGAVVAQAVQESGVRPAGQTAAGRAELARNIELARAIGATGTPTFVVGNSVFAGAVGYKALKDGIAAARAG